MRSAFSAKSLARDSPSSPAVTLLNIFVELVEGAVRRINREVAGEHAAVDAERLNGIFEPRGEGIDAHALQRHRETREFAHDVAAEGGQRVDTDSPQGALLVGIRPGPSGVLDDDDQIIEASKLRRRHVEADRDGP